MATHAACGTETEPRASCMEALLGEPRPSTFTAFYSAFAYPLHECMQHACTRTTLGGRNMGVLSFYVSLGLNSACHA